MRDAHQLCRSRELFFAPHVGQRPWAKHLLPRKGLNKESWGDSAKFHYGLFGKDFRLRHEVTERLPIFLT